MTGEFSEGTGSNDEIDDLQSQIDELVAQLEGCVDCNGDLDSDGIINVVDIVAMVNHILDVDSGDCITP